jgi:hypothetical protein
LHKKHHLIPLCRDTVFILATDPRVTEANGAMTACMEKDTTCGLMVVSITDNGSLIFDPAKEVNVYQMVPITKADFPTMQEMV